MFYTDSDNYIYVIFYYYSGIASMGVVCDTRSGAQKMKQSISEWQEAVSTFAWVRYFYLLIFKLLNDLNFELSVKQIQYFIDCSP